MEDEIRAWAHRRNNADREGLPQYKAFHDKVASYIDSIPLDPTKLKHCPACEGALCEVCGGCHEVDREFLFIGRDCPAGSFKSIDKKECEMWVYAYTFLQDGDKVARRQA